MDRRTDYIQASNKFSHFGLSMPGSSEGRGLNRVELSEGGRGSLGGGPLGEEQQ